MSDLVQLLIKKGYTIGSVESITGGLFSSLMVSIPNASQVYLGSVVSYANIIKENVLKIDKAIIDKYGVVSKEIAQLMCEHGYDLINADIMVSFTGNAGPSNLDNLESGVVFTCIKFFDEYHNYYDHLDGDRNKIREDIVALSVNRMIQLIIEKGE